VNTVAKLGAFVGGLGVAFGAAFAVGAAADPITSEPSTAHTARENRDGMGGMGGMADSTSAHKKPHTEHGADETGAALPGLAVSRDDYTLVPATTALPAGDKVPFRFTVIGPDGKPVTRYTPTHTKNLHLIVVRRDMAGFQHVHPTLGADGAWSVPVDVSAAGTYRFFADFAPADHDDGLTLGIDIAVAGDYQPATLPAPAVHAAADGYDVALSADPAAGRDAELTFTVTRNGAKVTDLQPYLGAFGHLVSLRGGDLAYLHTHPADEATAGERGGPSVRFVSQFPSAGTYRLFLDFRAGGDVHTAAFTVSVPTGQ
jgi:hypothetical protein